MAGPMTASSDGASAWNAVPSFATAASITPAAAPRHPAWTAPATRRRRSIRSTGTQSAVTTPTTRPAVALIRASASGGGPGAAVATRVPCTCRAVATGRRTPARATTASQAAAPAHSVRPRKPCARPGIAAHGAYVSIASLAGLRHLRYGARRVDPGSRAVRPDARARGPGAARLRRAARLAAAARRRDPRPAVDHGRALGSRLDALERHVRVAEQLLER